MWLSARVLSRVRLTAITVAAVAAVVALAAAGCAQRTPAAGSASEADAHEWVELFNGRDLADWTPKFAGRAAGLNYNETFRVEDGMLAVRYDRWSGFNGEFGHLFYSRRPLSHYVIAVEYRFVGAQVSGAGVGSELAWAVRNNGIMIHAQAPETMERNQEFPTSLEVQLLGAVDHGVARPTANLCTPGTNVVMRGVVVQEHCTSSTSRSFFGDKWVRVEVMVLGDSLIRHIVNGDTVLSYANPRVDGGGPLSRGYIAIQAETAPIDFRRIALLNLEGCTEPEAITYKRYFVKSDSTACFYAARR